LRINGFNFISGIVLIAENVNDLQTSFLLPNTWLALIEFPEIESWIDWN